MMSRNVRGGRLFDTAMGGLNYQIEHHLFPSMPLPHLRKAAPIIAAYVSVAFAGEDRYVDVGVAELEDESGARRSHAFMVMAGIGLDAEMAESTSTIAKKHLGWFAYVTPIGTRLTLQGLARRSPLSRRLLQQTPDLHALAYVHSGEGVRFKV